jgi:crotonobetainyl-CoA:carnitine CoA-transferase CaiB-like acyl-CoA transferase
VARGGFPRVIDFSTHWSGPFASRALVHLGADVVKIEGPKTGDGNRFLGDPISESTTMHFTINSGTRSATCDRHSPEWPQFVAAAARWADVAIVGARPSDARIRGLDFGTLVKANPRLVYCAITGYGEQGPWSGFPAHGLQPDAMAGVVPLDWVDGEPQVPVHYGSHGTILAGTWAALGILKALHDRNASGQPQYVSVSMWEAAMEWQWRDLQVEANFGRRRGGYQDLGSRYRMYRTKGDRAILVCPSERKYWEAFVDVVGLPADWRGKGTWATTGGLDNGADYPEEPAIIQERMLTKELFEWESLLTDAGVPAASVRTVGEAVATPHAEATGVMTNIEHNGDSVAIPRTPVSVNPVEDLSGGPEELQRRIAENHRQRAAEIEAPPGLGEHTKEVFEEFGVGHLVA